MQTTQKEKTISLDGIRPKRKIKKTFDLPLARYVLKYKKSPALFSKGKMVGNISSLGPGPNAFSSALVLDGITFSGSAVSFYSNSFGIAGRGWDPHGVIKERYSDVRNYFIDLFDGSVQGVGAVRMWNMSMAGAIIFGMFLMAMMYRYLGQGAAADSEGTKLLAKNKAAVSLELDKRGNEADAEFIARLIENYQKKKAEGIAQGRSEEQAFEAEIREMVKGYPIEQMAPHIAKKNRVVAAFLVGIAKKESNWGKRVPVLKGQDCYNYWGYRGIRKKMGTGGHTCFDSPKDAVDTVSRRLEDLIVNEKVNTPGKMVTVWKCGYDCSWDDPANVRKWVSDVDMYFRELDK